MNTMRNVDVLRHGADACEDRHRPLRALVWQVFGGFVGVVLTLSLAAAGHLTLKADVEDVRQLEVRTRTLEGRLAEIQASLAELRTGQQDVREDVKYVRQLLDQERKK